MQRRVVNLPETPDTSDLPYSSAVIVGDYVFVSGHVGSVLETGEVPAGIEAQTAQSLEDVSQVLQKAGTSLANVVKATVFLKNIEDFATMNQVYRRYFPKDPPARTTVGVAGLAGPDLLIEIEVVAILPAEVGQV